MDQRMDLFLTNGHRVLLHCTASLLLIDQRMIQHRSVLQGADPNPAFVRNYGQHAHYTRNSMQTKYRSVFSPSKTGSTADSTRKPVLMTV